MNDTERAALVRDLAVILQRVKYVPLGASLEPLAEEIIDRLLTTRPEPAADAVGGSFRAIRTIVQGIRNDVLPVGHTVRVKTTLAASLADMGAIERHLAKIEAALQAAAVEPGALLEELTHDSLPGHTVGVHRNEGEWGVQQMMTHLEEQYPTDIYGQGDTFHEALASAVRKAREAANATD